MSRSSVVSGVTVYADAHEELPTSRRVWSLLQYAVSCSLAVHACAHGHHNRVKRRCRAAASEPGSVVITFAMHCRVTQGLLQWCCVSVVSSLFAALR